jgi:hypothetical protein
MINAPKYLSKDQVGEIINSFEVKLEPVIKIARRFGLVDRSVYRILKKNGVDTSKRKYPVKCFCCGKEHQRTKGRIREKRKMYCSRECYFAALSADDGFPYVRNKYGMRIARKIVGKWFQLSNGNVVHHEDKNTLNNLKWNLKVFKDQGDHIKHHRGIEVKPVWDGGVE